MSRVVFMGTPDSAVPTLDVLASATDLSLVVTQPDRPQGRSDKPIPPPVKTRASEIGIPVIQPTNRAELIEGVGASGPYDLGVVVAYGRILPPEVLTIPDAGFLNVHFSLLPRWRGAAPVARAVMTGDTMTGVTIIQLDEGLDTGPVLTAQAVDIGSAENAGDLTDRLASLGARLLESVVAPYLSGDMEPVPQSEEGANYAARIEPDDRPLTWSEGAANWVYRVRGLAPTPAATLDIDGVVHKILEADHDANYVEPGTWRAMDGGLVVGTGRGSVRLMVLQPPGKTPQSGDAWLRGRRVDSGVVG